MTSYPVGDRDSSLEDTNLSCFQLLAWFFHFNIFIFLCFFRVFYELVFLVLIQNINKIFIKNDLDTEFMMLSSRIEILPEQWKDII